LFNRLNEEEPLHSELETGYDDKGAEREEMKEDR
jgi:hypothetical protein